MLARSFLAPEVLGITAKQHAALVEVLHMMERGELRHVDYDFDISGLHQEGAFNMQWWELPTSRFSAYDVVESNCGTVCCIGGWAERVGGRGLFSYYRSVFRDRDVFTDIMRDSKKRRLHDLFFPEANLSRITVDQASRALSSYLTTGRAGWDEIVRA